MQQHSQDPTSQPISLPEALRLLQEPPIASSADGVRFQRAGDVAVREMVRLLSDPDGVIGTEIREIIQNSDREQVFRNLLWPMPNTADSRRRTLWPLAYLLLMTVHTDEGRELLLAQFSLDHRNEVERYDNEEALDEVRSAAADAVRDLYFPPFANGWLAEAIEWLMQLPQPELRLEGRVARIGACHCKLSVQQAALLQIFLQHPSEAVSKEEIESGVKTRDATDLCHRLKKALRAKLIDLVVHAIPNPPGYLFTKATVTPILPIPIGGMPPDIPR